MAKAPNMKIGIGADTSDFEKGAKQVKQGLKDLSKTGEQSLSALGDAFGVNTGKVGQMTSAIRGLGQKMTEASNTGVQAFGKLLGSITPLGGAIAGLGLAAAIAGFKQLKSEAENFKSTIDGMNLSMATSAYISTYRQALHDANSDTGKAVAEAMSNWEKGLARFKANIGSTFVTAVGGDSKWYDAFLPTGIIRGWKQVASNIDEANAKAEEAARIGDEMAEQKKEQLQLDYEIKQIDTEIAAARRDASDKTKTAAERESARVLYAEKVNEKYDKQASLAERIAKSTEEMTKLTNSSYEATQAMYQAKGRTLEIETERQNELKAIDRLESSIAKSANSAAAAAKKQREEMEKIAAVQSKWAGMNEAIAGISGVSTPSTPGVTGPEMSILLHPKIDEKEAIDISRELASLIEQGAVSVSESIGNLIGDLVTGGDAWKNFTNGAISAFGDMAISVGKMAIATGVATLGIKEALESLNGYVAIAAGAALVALGSAVKTGLANIAGGDYSAAGGGYSSGLSYGSAGGGYETREVTVNVTGTLEADGDKLITVLNNTNRKNYYTR